MPDESNTTGDTMSTTEPAPLLHPYLPTPPVGLYLVRVEHVTSTGTDVAWGLHRRTAAPLDCPQAIDWLRDNTTTMNPTVESADPSDWYGEGDTQQRDLSVTFVDGSVVRAYARRDNPAAPGKRLDALDRIAAMLSAAAWPAVGGDVMFTDTHALVRNVRNVLHTVGYTIVKHVDPTPDNDDIGEGSDAYHGLAPIDGHDIDCDARS